MARAVAFGVGLVGHSLLALLLGAVSFVLLALATVIFPIVGPFVYFAAYVGGMNEQSDGQN